MENIDSETLVYNAMVLGTLASVLMVVGGSVEKMANGPLGGGKTCLAVAASVLILVQALKNLANAKGDIDGATNTMMVLMGALVAMNAAMEFTQSKFKSNVDGKTLLAMAASLYLIVMAMKKIAKMNPDEIRKGLGGVAAIMVVLAGVMLLSLIHI